MQKKTVGKLNLVGGTHVDEFKTGFVRHRQFRHHPVNHSSKSKSKKMRGLKAACSTDNGGTTVLFIIVSSALVLLWPRSQGVKSFVFHL